MPDIVRCKNIVEAIQHLEPNHILGDCLEHAGIAVNYKRNDAIRMPDGRIAFLCATGNHVLYRGENKIYDSCKASLYRIQEREDKIVALAKSYEFMEFLKTLPEVQYYMNNNLWYEPWAIAQHYEFVTPMIDLANEISVAAFFATHVYDKVAKEYAIAKKGVGQIRGCIGLTDFKGGKIRPIGVQPFARPGNQYGYGYWIPGDKDFAEQSFRIEFDQDYEVNKRLAEAMMAPESYYFPNEDISRMASVIRNENVVTRKAIDTFVSDNQYINPRPTKEEIFEVLSNKGVFIVDAPVICPEALPPRINAFTKENRLVNKPIYKKGLLKGNK